MGDSLIDRAIGRFNLTDIFKIKVKPEVQPVKQVELHNKLDVCFGSSGSLRKFWDSSIRSFIKMDKFL